MLSLLGKGRGVNMEVTWKWEYWREVSPRSGAKVLERFGQETRADVVWDSGVNRMLSVEFKPPLVCSGLDEVMIGQTLKL